jgi:AraC-like DNA-binding protein/mannose-6-phosphate isomerase-like protein (cupin superfamily)
MKDYGVQETHYSMSDLWWVPGGSTVRAFTEVRQQGRWDTGYNRHRDFLTFYFVRSGSASHWLEGETHVMTAGRAHVVPIGALHRIVSNAPLELDTVFFTLRTFHREQLRVLRAFLGLWPLSWGERAAGRPERTYPLHLSPAEAGEVARLTERLVEEARRRPTGYELMLRSLMVQLLVFLGRAGTGVSGEAVDPVPVRADEPLGGLLRFIEQHLDQDLRVEDLADRVSLSTGHFSRRFREAVGLSPIAYLRRQRIERARRLLRETDLPVGAIALQVGFNDFSYFARTFREVVGVTPRGYRTARPTLGGECEQD